MRLAAQGARCSSSVRRCLALLHLAREVSSSTWHGRTSWQGAGERAWRVGFKGLCAAAC